MIQIKEGTWWEEGGVRRTVSQLHEVVGFFGGRWLQLITQLLVGLSLLGTCIAQVVASSGNLYSIDNSHSKRYALQGLLKTALHACTVHGLLMRCEQAS